MGREVGRWVGVAVLLGLSACGGGAEEELGQSASAMHSWGGYHWARQSSPFDLVLVDSLTASWDGYKTAVESDWSQSNKLDLVDTTGLDDLRTRKQCKAVVGKLHACNASYGFNGWLGLAQIWLDADGHIVKATAKVNDSYFNTSRYDDADAKRHVLCQEVGHTLGLDHQDAVSCMNDKDGLFDPAYATPNAHDYEELGIIYAHLDSTTTVASAVVAASSPQGPGGDAEQGFGSPVDRAEAGGRPTMFVKAAEGGTVLTHVQWAGPREAR